MSNFCAATTARSLLTTLQLRQVAAKARSLTLPRSMTRFCIFRFFGINFVVVWWLQTTSPTPLPPIYLLASCKLLYSTLKSLLGKKKLLTCCWSHGSPNCLVKRVCGGSSIFCWQLYFGTPCPWCNRHCQAPKKVIRKARKPSVLKPGFAYEPGHSNLPFGEQIQWLWYFEDIDYILPTQFEL